MASSVGVLAIIRASRPVFRSKHERVVFAVHAVLMANGLRLLATGDKADEADAANPSEEASVDGWNASSEEYSFLYAFEVDKKVSKVLVKCLPLDGLLLCNLLNMDAPSGAPETLEVDVAQYTTEAEELGSSYQELPALVKRVQAALDDITTPVQVPSAAASAASTARTSEEPVPASVYPSTLGGGGSGGRPDRDDDDPLRLPSRPNPYTGGRSGGRGGHDPLMVGGRDVVPPGFPPPGGRRDPWGGGGIGGVGGGGGMHMGPNDPFFTDRIRHPDLHPGGRPPPGLPPGSRWDPINPEGLPGWQPGDFQRQGQPPLHPDLQQPGPGRGADWDSMYG